MSPEAKSKGWPSLLGHAPVVLASVGGVGLLLLVALVTLSVVTRYVFAMPLVGANELVQSLSVIVVMLALPWATKVGAHVRADVLDPFIGHWGRLIGDILSRMISITILALLAQRSYGKMMDALTYGDTTNMLGLPIWPLYGMIMLGIVLTIPVLAVQIVTVTLESRQTTND